MADSNNAGSAQCAIVTAINVCVASFSFLALASTKICAIVASSLFLNPYAQSISRRPGLYLQKTWPFDLYKTRSFDLYKTRTFDLHKTRSFNLHKTRSFDLYKTRSFDLCKTQTFSCSSKTSSTVWKWPVWLSGRPTQRSH